MSGSETMATIARQTLRRLGRIRAELRAVRGDPAAPPVEVEPGEFAAVTPAGLAALREASAATA